MSIIPLPLTSASSQTSTPRSSHLSRKRGSEDGGEMGAGGNAVDVRCDVRGRGTVGDAVG